MKIRMLKTEHGSVDGIRVAEYIDGNDYDLSATDGERELAAAFLAAGFAESADEPQKPAKPNKAAAKHETK